MQSRLRGPSCRLVLCAVLLGGSSAALAAEDSLADAIASPRRRPDFVARDVYRHPYETLSFFGIRPEQTVVEIWPGEGWYTEILAPYLKDKGKLYVAVPARDLPDAAKTRQRPGALHKLLASDAARFGAVVVRTFQLPDQTDICPPGSADLILTFRNVHDWIQAGSEQAAFDAFFKALKPGGILGVVEHRAVPRLGGLEKWKGEWQRTGYVDERYVRQLATRAGFVVVGNAAVNNNTRDTRNWPDGVWTLPPTLVLGGKDRQRYRAIGESDRMTVKFQKPPERNAVAVAAAAAVP